MLKSLSVGLVFKIGIAIGAAALAGGSGVLVYAWMTPSSVDVVATNTERIDNLDGTSRLVAAAGAAQDDYRAACEKRVEEFGSELRDTLDRLAAEHPDLASSMPTMNEGKPESACTLDWGTFVHDVCTTALEDRSEPSAEVLEALPEGLRPLVTDPCNAEWSKVDWGKAMADFDPGALMTSVCAAADKGDPTPEVKGTGSAEAEADNTVEIEGVVSSIGGTFDLSMNSLGLERLCERDLDFSAVTDFLHELDWESLLDGTAPTREEIDRLREKLRGSDDSTGSDDTASES